MLRLLTSGIQIDTIKLDNIFKIIKCYLLKIKDCWDLL